MYIKDQLIDSIEITNSLIHKIRIIQSELESRYCDIIDLSKSDPVFYIEGLPSRFNNTDINEMKILLN